jgi:hypothetical protein
MLACSLTLIGGCPSRANRGPNYSSRLHGPHYKSMHCVRSAAVQFIAADKGTERATPLPSKN